MTSMTSTADRAKAEHWCSLDRQAAVGPWRSVCACGWRSEWMVSATMATEAGLDHSADPDPQDTAR